ncbi:hypothetical protein NUW58_g4122 [Xylaria curta]|uniref:Uncharacterized protein n=1 Tax=Xylaria curta TaxID=42375 RepID=A0ACC1P7S8_9PEZI|nr:hypothetical protein NUW58_g4122 [Xylaria curta]
MIGDIELQYMIDAPFETNLYTKPTKEYQIESFAMNVFNGSASMNDSEYIPSPKLRRNDGDLYIIFLSGNGVYFSEPSLDVWYRASTRYSEAMQTITDSTSDRFIFDEPASPLGCVEQTQLCFEALPQGKQCGPLASFFDAFTTALRMSPSEAATAQSDWVLNQIAGATVDNVVKTLGAHALSSRRNLHLGSQGPIAQNQWQLDVTYWWATTLALSQGNFIDYTVGPSDRRLEKYIIPPMDTAICSSQVCETYPLDETQWR